MMVSGLESVVVGDEVRSFFKLHLATRLDTPALSPSFPLSHSPPCNPFRAPFVQARTNAPQVAPPTRLHPSDISRRA